MEGIQNIAEGAQVAGSVAAESGMSFEQFAASIAKVSETTRQDGSKIGNAYKTILARTSRSKSADSDVSLEDRGEAAKALASIGIEVYDQNGAYQDFSVTLDELSAKWDSLTDAQRANVSEALAGVRNINTMQQIIATWDEAKELAGMVEEDPNYYLEVQEKSMNSIQSNMDTLKATMQDFWYNFLNQDAINSGLQGLTSIAEVLASITKTAQGLPAIGDTLSMALLGTGAVGIPALIDNIWKSRQDMKKDGKSYGLFGKLLIRIRVCLAL